jgi:hypothetical protein
MRAFVRQYRILISLHVNRKRDRRRDATSAYLKNTSESCCRMFESYASKASTFS